MAMKFLGAALLSLTISSAVIAQRAMAQGAPPLTEQNLERGLVNLGLMAGHAFQCMPESERPVAQAALLAFNSILIAQMGSNAAFRFATSFGAGSSHEVDRAFCERSLADWRRHVQEHRLDR